MANYRCPYFSAFRGMTAATGSISNRYEDIVIQGAGQQPCTLLSEIMRLVDAAQRGYSMDATCTEEIQEQLQAAHLQIAAMAHDCVQLVHARVRVMLGALGRHSGQGAPALLPALEALRRQPGVHNRG